MGSNAYNEEVLLDPISRVIFGIPCNTSRNDEVDLRSRMTCGSLSGSYYLNFKVKAIGKFKKTKRTNGVSTSDVIMRIMKDYNEYVMRNLARGYSRKDFGVSYVKEKQLRVKMGISKLREKVKEHQEKLHTVAKTAGMHRNLWMENVDRWVAGFLEKFEEGCHIMKRPLKIGFRRSSGGSGRLFEHVEKGQQVFVSGRLVSDTVEGEEVDKPQVFYKVVVQELNFIERNMPPVLLYEPETNYETSGAKFGDYAGNRGGGSAEELWQVFFANPVDLWDNMMNKRNPKDTGEALWVEGKYNPPWVKSQLAILDSRLTSLQPNVEQLHRTFKLCGSPTEEYRKKLSCRQVSDPHNHTNQVFWKLLKASLPLA